MTDDIQGFLHREETTREPYHYTACGLDNVYLFNGYELWQTEDGEGVSIRDLDSLHHAIGLSLAEHKKLLSPKELRWFRKQLDLTQSELARLLGYSSQMVARWEKGECEINGAAERILRMLYIEQVSEEVTVRDVLQTLDTLDDVDETIARFEVTDQGWRTAQAL